MTRSRQIDPADRPPVGVVATRRAAKELVDGTIRVQFDIDPAYRTMFFAMFPDIDMPVAIAPLKVNSASAAAREPNPETEPVVSGSGGDPSKHALSRYAAMLGQDDDFREWLSEAYAEGQPLNEAQAAEVIRQVCEVDSRSEFDTDPEAAARFHANVREPWAAQATRRRR